MSCRTWPAAESVCARAPLPPLVIDENYAAERRVTGTDEMDQILDVRAHARFIVSRAI